MATKPSTLFLSNPWRGYAHNHSNTHASSSSSSSSRLIPTSCKMRARNPSSRQKRQQAKIVSPTQLSMNKSLQPNCDEDTAVSNDMADLISSSHQHTLSENSLLTGEEGTKIKSEAEDSSSYTEILIDENTDTNDESTGGTGSRDESIEDTDSSAAHMSSYHLVSSQSNDESTEPDVLSVPSSHQESSSVDEVASSTVPVDTDLDDPTLLEETPSMIESDRNGEHVQLEDLIGMIKNAEKNILLLNQARLRSAEDLDKILLEKENLKGEIYMLEARLAETDSQIEGAVQAKVHVELLEGELEKLKLELSEKKDAVGGEDNIDDKEKILNKDNDSASSVGNELRLLKEESISLKDDIHLLKQELTNLKETDAHILALDNERSSLEAIVKNLESRLLIAEGDVSKIYALKLECKDLWAKVGNLQELLDKATKQADEAISVLQQNYELRKKVDRLEESVQEAKLSRISSEKMQQYNELMQQKIGILEERLARSDEEIHSHVLLYQESIKDFQDILETLKEDSKRKALDEPMDEMPWEFWSRLLLMIDGWFLEKKISSDDAKLLGEMTWKRDKRICNAYLASKTKNESEMLTTFLNLISSPTSSGLHIIHIAAEMAPVAKVGGLGDVVSGLGKALQKKGHLVEIVIPKYDCMQYDRVSDLRVLDAVIESYFDGRLYKNKIWVGIVEGLPVYFIEPQHPANFFGRGQFYGENDDFKRFSYFSRVALELLFQAGKRPDIIHCHDWQTSFVAPLYWDLYAKRGLDSARICFTCHNFEYQGTKHASELASCGLDVLRLNRPDRMQDHSAHDRVNPLKGAIVYSNIVTTVSPTYAQEVRTPEGGRGLHRTLNSHSKKFIGVLNGIDTDAWDPATDNFLKVQFNADDLQGKMENKEYLRKYLKLSSADSMQPLVGCITRLVPQKGVHLIRQAIYRTLELGGQFVLLGSSPVENIQREFEGIAKHFESHPHIRLILKYDEALSHSIYAASDMFIIPSLFEPCGLTQMIAMRYGSIPIVRKTGGLNDSVFDIDDETIPLQFRNGFTFLNPDEQGINSVLERAFARYTKNNDSWRELVRRNMVIDFSWDASASQYIELYRNSVTRRDSVARVGLKHA